MKLFFLKHFRSAFFLVFLTQVLPVWPQGLNCSHKNCGFDYGESYSNNIKLPDFKEVNYLVFDDVNTLKIKNVDNNDHPLYVSIIGVLISLLLPFWIDYRNKKKSIFDDFWIRQVIYPKYVDKIIEFSMRYSVISENEINKSELVKFVDENARIMSVISNLNSVLQAMNLRIDTNRIAEILVSNEALYIEAVDIKERYAAEISIFNQNGSPRFIKRQFDKSKYLLMKSEIDKYVIDISKQFQDITVEIVKAIHKVQK